MTCDKCKSKIENSLSSVDGVRVVDINVSSQKVLLEFTPNAHHTVIDLQQKIENDTGIRTVVKGLGTELAAVSELHGPQDVVGVVRMAQVLDNKCIFNGAIEGLFTNANERVSLDIHEFGDLSGDKYENIGGVRVAISELAETKPNRSSFRYEVANCDLSQCIGRAMAVQDSITKRVIAAGIVARASPVGSNVKKVCACSGKTLWEERDDQSNATSV